MSETLTQNRLSILKSIEDSIDQHRSDVPDSNIPAGDAANAIGFLLEFYENVRGWEFSSTKRLSERYNASLIENKLSAMSSDY